MALNKLINAHICSFLQPTVSTILCISTNRYSKICAIGRQNGAIELWSLEIPHYLIRTLAGDKEFQLRKITWFFYNKTKLISVGLSGSIITWDCKNGRNSLSNSTNNKSPIWDVLEVKNKKELWIACDDGTLKINNVRNESYLIQQDVIPCCSGRNISLCLSTNESLICVGTNKSKIFIIDTRTKQNTEAINLNKKNRNNVYIWTLENISNLQFASGNSIGEVSIWDWILGTPIASFCISFVPILSVKTLNTGSNFLVFSGGSEGKVQELINGKKEYDWYMGKWIRPHLHDITSMFVNKCELWTASNDGCFSVICPKTLKTFGKIYPFYNFPPKILKKQRQVVILDWDFSKIRVWHIKNSPKLTYSISSNMKCTVTSCSINKTGNLIVATDQLEIKAWSLSKMEILKLHIKEILGCISTSFHEMKSNILLINYDNFAEIIDCSVPMVLAKMQFHKGSVATWVKRWIVVKTESEVILYNPKTKLAMWKLPKFLNFPRQVYMYQKDKLFVLYNDNVFRFFDLKDRCLTTWSKVNESLISLLPQCDNIESISHCSLCNPYLLLNAQNWFVMGNVYEDLNFKPRTLRKRVKRMKNIEESIKSCWSKRRKFFTKKKNVITSYSIQCFIHF